MKRKSILLEGTKTTVGEADRRILDNYLTNYEIHEFPRNGTAYSLTDEDGFDIEIELFGQRYQLEVYPNELRTDDFQVAIDGKPVPAEARSPCSTFKGNVQGTDRAVRLSIDEYGISGFIQLEDQKLYITKSMKFKLPGSRPTLFVAYYEKDVDDSSDFNCGVTPEHDRQILKTLPKPSDVGPRTSHCRFLKIATDADFAFFQIYGSAANAEILDIINMIEGVYVDTFDVSMRVTFQNVWTTNDPYTGDPSTNAGAELLLEQLRNYWQTNFTGVLRDVVHLFTGVNANISGTAGIAYLGTICNNPSYAYGLTRERFQQFLTTAHEIGHNFSGEHADGVNCGTSSASIMCQGTKQIPMYFSQASITRISNFINANSFCLSPSQIFRIVGDSPICSSEVFTVSNLRQTETAGTWSVSPAAAATITGSGNSRTLTRSSAYNGTLTLSVILTTDCGAVNISRVLFAGIPVNASVDGFTSVPTNYDTTYIVQNVLAAAQVYDYQWFIIPNTGTGAGGGGITPIQPGVAEIWFANPGEYVVGCNLFNPCGWVEAQRLIVWAEEWPFAVKDNGEKESITISVAENKGVEASELVSFEAFIVDSDGREVRSGISSEGKVVIETKGLPESTYVLHIRHGNMVEKRSLIIRVPKKQQSC